MIRLGVNIDHIATIRNARGEAHPDPENSRPPYVNKLVIKNTFIISIIDRNTGRFKTMSM